LSMILTFLGRSTNFVSFSTKASISSFMAVIHSSSCYAELIASQYDVGSPSPAVAVRADGRISFSMSSTLAASKCVLVVVCSWKTLPRSSPLGLSPTVTTPTLCHLFPYSSQLRLQQLRFPTPFRPPNWCKLVLTEVNIMRVHSLFERWHVNLVPVFIIQVANNSAKHILVEFLLKLL
jgi:hypothetical protein